MNKWKGIGTFLVLPGEIKLGTLQCRPVNLSGKNRKLLRLIWTMTSSSLVIIFKNLHHNWFSFNRCIKRFYIYFLFKLAIRCL